MSGKEITWPLNPRCRCDKGPGLLRKITTPLINTRAISSCSACGRGGGGGNQEPHTILCTTGCTKVKSCKHGGTAPTNVPFTAEKRGTFPTPLSAVHTLHIVTYALLPFCFTPSQHITRSRYFPEAAPESHVGGLPHKLDLASSHLRRSPYLSRNSGHQSAEDIYFGQLKQQTCISSWNPYSDTIRPLPSEAKYTGY